jgi:eukaryotic-like serine/threonine-protein kinase
MSDSEGDPAIPAEGNDEPTRRISRSPREEMPGLPERIGPYRLLSRLGQGGFGVVFLAEQSEPVRRRVALKVIKPGMDSAEVLARFEAERQALAVMDHPNVAKVFDGGATPQGWPYFVMELVQGVPITEHCDRHQLGIRERIELFIEVCHAVQHAHMKGVIHRDLKPTNILVEYQEGSGGARAAPKVIDFGVAKALNQRLTERTLYTEIGHLIGTPEYMSPEQAEMSGQDIDTRADIYSLGVILYELLAGGLPFDPESLRSAGLLEIHRLIREAEPLRPSTRLGTVRAGRPGPGQPAVVDLESIARLRRTDGRSLLRALRGDLDWVVMKCLEKDRSRRYETVNALAMELKRYLDHEPVHAGPPSAAYRLRKFVRRHRGAVAAATAVGVALILGIAGISLALAEANRQRLAAEAATAQAQQRAEELELVAEFQASQLADVDTAMMGARMRDGILEKRRAALESIGDGREAIERGLGVLEESLAGVNFTNVALEALDENIFERALVAIQQQFGDQPLIQARLLQTVAITMRDLGLLERATRPQEEALEIRHRELGAEHPMTLASLYHLGRLLYGQGRLAEAEPHLRQALETQRVVLGEEHPDTLASLNQLGFLLYSQGRFAEAEGYLHEALEAKRRVLGTDHRETLGSISNMGSLLFSQGRLTDAEPFFREALEISRRLLGDEHPDTLASMSNMGSLLFTLDQLAEAEPYFREALAIQRRVQGDEHPHTLRLVNNTGRLWHRLGDLEKAEPFLREALEVKRRVLGDEHPDTLVSVHNMARLLRDMGRLDEAYSLGEEAVSGARVVLPPGNLRTGGYLFGHAQTLAAMGRFADAEAGMLEAHEILEAAVGADHDQTLEVIQGLADLYGLWHDETPAGGHDASAARWRARLEAAKASRRS